jgi:chemotaxis protein MotA
MLNNEYLDLTTLLGITAAILAIIFGIITNGKLSSFIDPASISIVLVGTFSATTACFSLRDVLKSHLYITKTIFFSIVEPSLAATNALELSIFARKNGLASLELYAKKKNFSNFFIRGIEMVADQVDVDGIEKLFTQELISTQEQQFKVISILRKAAEIAPAMGLIGTLIGLVQMLGTINDVSKIGSAMALAILTTFYGAVLAYVIFFPLASKLERNSKDRILISRIYLTCLLSVAKNDNPRLLEKELNSLLSAINYINYFKK